MKYAFYILLFIVVIALAWLYLKPKAADGPTVGLGVNTTGTKPAAPKKEPGKVVPIQARGIKNVKPKTQID